MRGLLLKDYYVLSGQMKRVLLAVVLVAVSTGGVLGVYVMLLGAMIPTTIIAYDERSKWNDLAAMLPYTAKELVVSKFLIGYIGIAIGAICTVMGSLIMSRFNPDIAEVTGKSIIILICLVSMYLPINIPVLLKYGSEKGRYIYFIAIMIGVFSYELMDRGTFMINEYVQTASMFFLIMITCIVNIVGIKWAIKVMEKN